jgi:hypothetical protein
MEINKKISQCQMDIENARVKYHNALQRSFKDLRAGPFGDDGFVHFGRDKVKPARRAERNEWDDGGAENSQWRPS